MSAEMLYEFVDGDSVSGRRIIADYMRVSASVERQMSMHIQESDLAQFVLDAGREYRQTMYAKVTDLVPSCLFLKIKAEVESAFEVFSVRRDLVIEATNSTPRKMSNLRYRDIYQACPVVRATYFSGLLRMIMSAVVGEPIFDCPWEDERYVATYLHKSGDTHGWHWDDYAYSLLWILEAPNPSLGGSLEFVPNTSWDKENPNIHKFLSENSIEKREHVAGDLYVFRSDKVLHRVSPILEGAKRVALNMVFASAQELSAKKTHETMAELFA